MFSMSKSTGRLMWALSLLGFDRLMRMMGAGPSWERHGGTDEDDPESHARVIDELADRVRGLMGPGISSMFEAGERIIERFFGMGQGSWPEPWHDDGLRDSHWPFPTTPPDRVDHDGSHHGPEAHPLDSHLATPGGAMMDSVMDHPGHDSFSPAAPHSPSQHAAPQHPSWPSSNVQSSPSTRSTASTPSSASNPGSEDNTEDWAPPPKIPDIATYFETGSRSKKQSPATRPIRRNAPDEPKDRLR